MAHIQTHTYTPQQHTPYHTHSSRSQCIDDTQINTYTHTDILTQPRLINIEKDTIETICIISQLGKNDPHTRPAR